MRSAVLTLAAVAAAAAAAPPAAAAPLELLTAGSPEAPAFRAGSGPADLAPAGTGVRVTLRGTYDLSGNLVTPGGLLDVAWDRTAVERVGPTEWGDAGAAGIAAARDGTTSVALSRRAQVADVSAAGAVALTQTLADGPKDVAVGADGDRWLSVPGRDSVVRVGPSGVKAEHVFAPRAPFASNSPSGVVADGTGRIWVALSGTERLAVVDPTAGSTTVSYVVLPAGAQVGEVGLGPDGRVWATDEKLDQLYAVTPATGAYETFHFGQVGVKLSGVAGGPDGVVYFGVAKADAIGRIRTDGTLLASLPTGLSGKKIEEVERGADGNVWFTVQGSHIGRVFVAPGASALTASRTTDGALQVAGTVHPRSKATAWTIEYGTSTAYGQRITGTVPAGPSPVAVSATLPEPPDGQAWHVRLVADSGEGRVTTGPDALAQPGTGPAPSSPAPTAPATGPAPAATAPTTSTTPETTSRTDADPPGLSRAPGLDGVPQRPEVGRRVVVGPAAGTVRVTLPGHKLPVELDSLDDVPFGAVLDTRKGRVRLTSAVDKSGAAQTAEFWGGVFTVQQGGGVTELHVRGPVPRCVRPGARAAAVKKKRAKRVVRRLWGKDRHGKFRTHGRDSVATVRGTRWLVEESCRSTTTRVAEGAVEVKDRRTGRKVLVRAGQRYIALKAPKRVKGR